MIPGSPPISQRFLDLLLEKHQVKQDGYTLGRLKEELSRYHLVDMKIGSSKHRTLQKIPAELSAITYDDYLPFQ